MKLIKIFVGATIFIAMILGIGTMLFGLPNKQEWYMLCGLYIFSLLLFSLKGD